MRKNTFADQTRQGQIHAFRVIRMKCEILMDRTIRLGLASTA